ncbi:hypothetical protein TPHA_0A05160 [Tetrapisispora phaffii CBS 4417]|uniref:Uncharacterized protein n=1 Tax=Tetrapisispora phaffii (strain ATCC 24235 / CBS 4417 / NBRC 1672 / NRRL Y-8282 / UCD 70-5) TaxID=1071381 RepID=G8BNW3_TETPH|nr:hypothetical protein TPHA_0A05160 [Tetrapisispora phaffii CBS 4417]CCE61591.1 hypothetical protein TPHA_0A05160 [Tetrapisispora phaffii CBS 4417]
MEGESKDSGKHITLISEFCNKYNIDESVKNIYGIRNKDIASMDYNAFLKRKYEILLRKKGNLNNRIAKRNASAISSPFHPVVTKQSKNTNNIISETQEILISDDTFFDQTLIETQINNINQSYTFSYHQDGNLHKDFNKDDSYKFCNLISSENNIRDNECKIHTQREQYILSSNYEQFNEENTLIEMSLICSSPVIIQSIPDI